MKAKRLLALVLALVLVLALFAGCSNNDQTTSSPDTTDTSTDESSPTPSETTSEEKATETASEAAGEPIKIGHIVDLTGVESSTGQTAVDSFNFAIEYIDNQIAGRPIEVITEDAQSDSSIAVDVAKKLVEQDGVDIIFGPTQVGHKSAVAAYMAEVGVPVVFYNATPPGLLKSGNEWVVAAGGVNDQMPTVMAAYLYEEMGYETVYTLAQDNTGGRSYIEPFTATFEALGGTVVDSVYTPTGSSDFASYLAGMTQDADALVSWVSGSDAIALWSAWYEGGLYNRMPMVGTMHGGFTDYFVANALNGKNPAMAEAMMESALAPIFYGVTSDTEENQAFVAAWQEEFGEIPLGSNLPGACAQAILLLQAAVEATDGDTTPEVLRDALLAADVMGPEGHTYFTGSQAATKDVYIVKVVQLEDGTFNYETVEVYKDVPPSGYVTD